MLSRAKKVARDVARLPSIPKELVDLFLTGPMTGDAIDDAGVAFKKALIEASLNAELSHHLGYPLGGDKLEQVSNHRSGSTSKTVLTGDGTLQIETPIHDGLGWLIVQGVMLDDEAPAARITSVRVRSYVAFLQEGRASVTVASYLGTLCVTLLAMFPETDWAGFR